MSRHRNQTTLFPQAEFISVPSTWSVASFSIATLIDDSGHDHAISPIARAIRQALENVKARRDPAMHLASFDILAGAVGDCYFVAMPENLSGSIAGMIERKLLELPSFVRLKRSQLVVDPRFRPFAYYEAGAIWVLQTPSLRGETPFAGQGVAVRNRMASSAASECQMTFDYVS